LWSKSKRNTFALECNKFFILFAGASINCGSNHTFFLLFFFNVLKTSLKGLLKLPLISPGSIELPVFVVFMELFHESSVQVKLVGIQIGVFLGHIG
jgi:hypothetical protein